MVQKKNASIWKSGTLCETHFMRLYLLPGSEQTLIHHFVWQCHRNIKSLYSTWEQSVERVWKRKSIVMIMRTNTPESNQQPKQTTKRKPNEWNISLRYKKFTGIWTWCAKDMHTLHIIQIHTCSHTDEWKWQTGDDLFVAASKNRTAKIYTG